MLTRSATLVFSLLLILLATPFLGADTREDWEKMRKITPLNYVATRAAGRLTIDGKLDDRAWDNARWSEPHSDIEGDLKPKPRFDTRFKLLWDKKYLYFGCLMEEPHVWGTLTKHDSVIFHDNDIEIFIDPDGDNHEYYEFEMNALNTGWDLFLKKPYKDGGPADNSWEIPGLKTAVHINGTLNDPSDTDRSWSVEVAIPWEVLSEYAYKSSPPKDGDHWRMNFSRVEWKHQIVDGKYQKTKGEREDNWVWSPQGIIDMHRPERWGYVWFTNAKQFHGQPPTDSTLKVRDLLMTVYHTQKALQRSHQRLYKSIQDMGLQEEMASAFKRHQFQMTINNNETWEATLDGDGVKMKIDHQSRLTTVK